MIKFHSEPRLKECEWRMIFCANNRRAVSTQGSQDWCACTSHISKSLPHSSEVQVLLEELWDRHASLPLPGEERSSSLFTASPFPNLIITALKADIWQKPPESEQGEGAAAFVGGYYLITLFSCEMLGVCLCRAIIYLAGVCHHNYPPETQNWSGCRRNRGHSKGGEESSPN